MNREEVVIASYIGADGALGHWIVVEPRALHMLSPSAKTKLHMLVTDYGDGDEGGNDDVYGYDAGPEH